MQCSACGGIDGECSSGCGCLMLDDRFYHRLHLRLCCSLVSRDRGRNRDKERGGYGGVVGGGWVLEKGSDTASP